MTNIRHLFGIIHFIIQFPIDKKINETIYRSEFTDGKFSRPKVANDLPIGSFQNVSSSASVKILILEI
jgi:hypothetical protein